MRQQPIIIKDWTLSGGHSPFQMNSFLQKSGVFTIFHDLNLYFEYKKQEQNV